MTTDSQTGKLSGTGVAYYVTTEARANAIAGLKVSDAADAKTIFTVTKAGDSRWNVTLNSEAGDVSGALIAEKLNSIKDNEQAAFVKSTTDVKANSDGKAEIDVTSSGAGYYLITSSLGSKLVVETLGNVTINEKNDKPSNDKKVMAPNDNGEGTKEAESTTASVGDTVTFHVNVTVPASADKKITVVDIISPGLDMVTEGSPITATITAATSGTTYSAPSTDPTGWTKDSTDSTKYTTSWSTTTTKVTANGTVSSTESENTYTKYTVEIPESIIKAIAATYDDDATAASAKIQLSYTAVLNDAAVVGTAGNPNKAHIEYSNYTTNDSEVKVYTYEFDLVKTDNDTQTKHILQGAQFELYAADQVEGTTTKALKSGAKPIKFLKTAAVAADQTTNAALTNIYKVAKDQNNSNAVSTIDAESVRIAGLGNGTYYLKETKAPDGYNLLPDLTAVTINSANQDATTVSANGSKYINATGFNSESDTAKTYTKDGVHVENAKGSVLPSTGGIGTTIFYVIGGVLIAGAAVLLIARKRKRA